MSEEQDEHDQQRRRDQHRLNTQQLGRAENTRGGDASAKKFYNTYRALCGRATTFDEMLETEIEADNLEMEIVELMMFISNTPIPQKYGALFKPPPGKGAEGEEDNDNDPEPTKVLGSSTLLRYVGGIIQLLWNKFPDHEEFTGLGRNESPEFWTLDSIAFPIWNSGYSVS